MKKQMVSHTRWYDRYIHIRALVNLTEQLPRHCQVHVGQKLLQIVALYQTIVESQSELKSLGAEEIQTLYKSKKRLRWYDEVPELHKALTSMAILPNEILMNINYRMEAVSNLIQSRPNLKLQHPEVVNRTLDEFLDVNQFIRQ